MVAMIWLDSSGASASRLENSARLSTSTATFVFAVTVAVRGRLSSNAFDIGVSLDAR